MIRSLTGKPHRRMMQLATGLTLSALITGQVLAQAVPPLPPTGPRPGPDGGRGGDINRNDAPILFLENEDQTTPINATFNYDATQAGTTFSDPDGDTLTYNISITPAANGLTTDGGSIAGPLTTDGTHLVVITATDPDGESVSDDFLLTIGDGNSTRLEAPALPATPLSYEDTTTNLPGYYRRGPTADRDNTPVDNPITDEGATLGRVLFYDTLLSANNTVSCASCHIQTFGFSDPRKLSVGFDHGLTGRQSMSLANARFYERGHFFWDERADTLEDQVLMPIQDAVEMGMTLTELEVKLQDTAYYPALFADAFGDDTVTSDRIARALAQFIRAITSSNSRYDAAVQLGTQQDPDFEAVFTNDEIQGLVLFGQGGDREGRNLGCARCHGSRALTSDDIHNNGLDDGTNGDDGAGNGRFKAPSLRNIEFTAPYMHDGRFNTLDEVVEFYNSGVQDHPNLDNRLRGRNGTPRRLNMTDAEKAALVAFLKTLTDTDLMTDERFSDPFVLD